MIRSENKSLLLISNFHKFSKKLPLEENESEYCLSLQPCMPYCHISSEEKLCRHTEPNLFIITCRVRLFTVQNTGGFTLNFDGCLFCRKKIQSLILVLFI